MPSDHSKAEEALMAKIQQYFSEIHRDSERKRWFADLLEDLIELRDNRYYHTQPDAVSDRYSPPQLLLHQTTDGNPDPHWFLSPDMLDVI